MVRRRLLPTALTLAVLGTTPSAGAAQGVPCPSPIPSAPAPSATSDTLPPPVAWDLRCIQLFPTPRGGSAGGVVRLTPPPSPFAVSVTPQGRHLWRLQAELQGLPDPSSLGPWTTYVAWATPLTLDPVVKLGAVRDGRMELGEVDFSKFLVWITAEASAEVEGREGPLVLRGRSPSSRMEAHDLLAQAPSAVRAPEMAGHAHGGADADGWTVPPAYDGVPMLPGVMALRPGVSPLRLDAPSGPEAPEAAPREVIALPDGGTLDLEAGYVRKRIQGRELTMLAFNGQHPGPLIRVAQNTTLFVNFTNRTPFPTAVHWHGLRLDNRFDGVPGVTQDPVQPGETFRYTLRFPDAGVYWYHPHHREDVQQELGLYGNMLVDAPEPTTYGPVNREEVLMLDDLLLDDAGVVAFGREAASHALMGRFGTTFLVNGEPGWAGEARPGEVVRFFLTNASNTRTFNLSFRRTGRGPDASVLPVKVVATDVGRFEREARVESVVLAPAERYVVDVLFPEAGSWSLVNHVHGINHRMGTFLGEHRELGRVEVAGAPPDEDLSDAFGTLRTHPDVVAEIDPYRERFDDPVDLELVMTLEADDLPLAIRESMRFDWVYVHPVEWTGTMPMMNWVVDADDVDWTIREPATGAENMDIDWRFHVGDVVKIRVHNDRSAFHVMQHPLHIHGQRFLVLAQDGVPNDNLAWKDTVLLPAGSTTDILLELSNPGRWMVHCHISEHLESGMKFVFEVEGG